MAPRARPRQGCRGRGQAVCEAREPATVATLAPLAGNFEALASARRHCGSMVTRMVLELQGLGSQLKLEPWDGDVLCGADL